MALIGITVCGKLEDYRQAVIHVGGEVLILERSMTPVDALNGIGGLLLPGGGDVEPARYGEEPHPASSTSNLYGTNLKSRSSVRPGPGTFRFLQSVEVCNF
jgi:gamma-glutamyl-gamma-aminobutyrate hydrolase PuuD